MYDKESLHTISRYMVSNTETIAVAESVTAGNLQTALALANDATKFFQGGITAYNIGQKCRHLHIDPIHALSCNCVSERVAKEMATNVGKTFLSNWGIGITGYAAMIPEIKELFAFYAIVHNSETILSGVLHAANNDAYDVQQYYTNEILKRLAQVLIASN